LGAAFRPLQDCLGAAFRPLMTEERLLRATEHHRRESKLPIPIRSKAIHPVLDAQPREHTLTTIIQQAHGRRVGFVEPPVVLVGARAAAAKLNHVLLQIHQLRAGE